MKFFAVDSPLMRFLNRVGDVVLLNVVFLASCLPVVTIGAALSALNATAMKLVRGDCDSAFDDYVAAFRANWRQATPLWLLVALVLSALGGWAVVLQALQASGLVKLALWAVLFLLAGRVALALPYLFAYQATFDDPIRVIVKNSGLMSIRHLPTSLMMLSLLVLPAVVTAFYPKVFLYGLVWLALGAAALACANGVLLNQVFARYGLELPDRVATLSSPADAASAPPARVPRHRS